jgi:hypothetical protein
LRRRNIVARRFEVDPPARIHGSWSFYFLAPGGFVIEVLG